MSCADAAERACANETEREETNTHERATEDDEKEHRVPELLCVVQERDEEQDERHEGDQSAEDASFACGMGVDRVHRALRGGFGFRR